MRRGLSSVAALGVAASLFAAASTPIASAKSGYFTVPAERIRQLTIKGTHGFRITIARISGRVELTASNGNTAAIYVVPSAKSPTDKIEATFPGLGEVSVRFRPSGRVHRESGFCEQRPSFRQNGIFRGTIRFEGEQGFTRVDVGSAPGLVLRSFKEVCKGSRRSESGAVPTFSLTASARSEGKTTVFNTTKSVAAWVPDHSTSYFASQWERRHGMLSAKVASANADGDTFAIAGPPFHESATVAPPLPFIGTAAFQAFPDAQATWEGTLAVELPGIGSVPLTGSQFRPELCRRQRCVGRPNQ
jgi:hypothetical protein